MTDLTETEKLAIIHALENECVILNEAKRKKDFFYDPERHATTKEVLTKLRGY